MAGFSVLPVFRKASKHFLLFFYDTSSTTNNSATVLIMYVLLTYSLTVLCGSTVEKTLCIFPILIS